MTDMNQTKIRLFFIMLNVLALVSVYILLVVTQTLVQKQDITSFAHTKEKHMIKTEDDDVIEGDTGPEKRENFQTVGDDGQSHVYSAFYDDIETPIIRVIALVKDFHKVGPKYKFTCTYPETPGNSSLLFRGTLQYVPEPESWGYSYRSAFIRCEVPKDQRPSTVTVSQSGKLIEKNRLTVTYPTHKKWRVTRCFSVLHSNFNNAMQILQTMEISILFGVEHFLVYIYNIHPSVLRILKKYQTLGILDILAWNLPFNQTRIHYFGQLAVIQECIYRNLHVSDYILTGDTDEIFVPKLYSSLIEMIEDNLKHRDYCSALAIRQSFFPLNIPPNYDDFSSKSEAMRLNLTYLLHTTRLKVDNPYERSKLVIKPEGVEIGSIHDVESYRRGRGGCACQYNRCLLHHYRHVDNEAMGSVRATDTSLRRYSDIIVKRIRDRLNVFGISH